MRGHNEELLSVELFEPSLETGVLTSVFSASGALRSTRGGGGCGQSVLRCSGWHPQVGTPFSLFGESLAPPLSPATEHPRDLGVSGHRSRGTQPGTACGAHVCGPWHGWKCGLGTMSWKKAQPRCHRYTPPEVPGVGCAEQGPCAGLPAVPPVGHVAVGCPVLSVGTSLPVE